MAIIYSGFQINAEELLDSRQIVSSSDQLPTIKHPCEGLIVWSKAENCLFVYKQDIDKWIQLPIVIPKDVLYPIDGSIKYDEYTMQLMMYHNGSWYGTKLTKIDGI